MKKIKRTTAIIMVTCMLIGLLSGCTATAEGKALYDAMIKSQSIKSSQNDMQVTLSLDATGLSEEDKVEFEQAKAMINGSKLSMNMKQTANADNTAAKAEVDMDITFGGMTMDMGVWVDMDLSSANPKFLEVIKLPPMFTAMDPSMAGKEYMVMDIGKMMNSPELAGEASNMNYADLMKVSTELQKKATTFLTKYLAQYNPGFKFITDGGTKSIVTPEGTVKAHIYKISLDDKTAKKLVRYTVNNFADSKDAMDFATEYIKFMQDITAKTAGTTSSTVELEKMMKDFETKKPELLAEFNSYMDKIENIKLVGDKGITFEYAVDEKGYLVSQSGNMNFVIDTAKLEALEGTNSVATGIYNVALDFSMLSYNINKDMKINMPTVTPANSIDYAELMKAAAPAPEPAPAVPAKALKAAPTAAKVLVNGKVVSFDAYTIDGSNYFKLRDIANAVNGSEKQFDVTFDAEKKIINLVSSKAYTVVGGEMKPGDGKEKAPVVNASKIMKNGVEVPLSAYTINGNNYFKLRDLAQAFDIGITWDGATQTIGIDTAAGYVAQ